MSTTATKFDLKQHLIDTVNRIGETYVNDLAFIDKDKQAQCPMGAARPATEFTAECAGFNFFISKAITGEGAEMPSEEARKQFYADHATGEKAAAVFTASVGALRAAIEGATEESLMTEITLPWGDAVPGYRAVQMCTAHMMYHDGQINYLQALHGDAENHWG